MTKIIDIGLLRDVVEMRHPEGVEEVSDFELVATFTDMSKLYPETYDCLVSILLDWLNVQMPEHVGRLGTGRCLAWVMGLLEIKAALLQGRKVPGTNGAGWQFRVVFDDLDIAQRTLERGTPA